MIPVWTLPALLLEPLLLWPVSVGGGFGLGGNGEELKCDVVALDLARKSRRL